MPTENEKRSTVEDFIDERRFRIRNLTRLYGENGSARIGQNRAEISIAHKNGYEYVSDPGGFWRRRVGLDKPRVQSVPVISQVLELLRRDARYMYQLTPDQFELFVCDRLDHMGFAVERVGKCHAPDGGVDIIACPRVITEFPFLLAVQAKHHGSSSRKTGPGAVKELQAVVATQPFQAGLLVTNTTFTPDARWFAGHKSHIVRLRDCEDLRRWLYNDFVADQATREIPETIELRPGLVVRVPRK